MANPHTIQKELKAEISRLKKSNTAYKNNNASLKESLKFKEADYKRIREDYVVDTDALKKEKHDIKGQLNEVIQKQKAELVELKEKNAAQVGVINAKEARMQDLIKVYNELVTDHKLLKSKAIANQAGLKIRQLVGVNPDATTEQMINAVHLLKTQVDRMTHEFFNANVDIETYRYLIGNIKKLLNVDKNTTIGTAIINLQIDLEAARNKEDKNGHTLNLIQSIINLNK